MLGELQSVDGYMNIALEDAKEYVDGKLRRNYGDAFVRGNNGEVSLSISLRSSAPSSKLERVLTNSSAQSCTFQQTCDFITTAWTLGPSCSIPSNS